MRTLTATQTAIISGTYKTVTWLFQVVNKASTHYYWSTKHVSVSGLGIAWEAGVAWLAADAAWSDGSGGTGYDFRIVDFDGILVARPRPETGLMPPSELLFSATNPGSTLDPDDFEGGYVRLILVMADAAGNESEIAAWKFKIKRVSAAYQTLAFTCEDFFQQYLEGSYPTLPKAHDIFPETSGVGNLPDAVCLPQPFGVAYVPIRPAYIVDGWYYVLGPTSVDGSPVTYTITAVRSPRDYSVKAEYLVTFTQATKTDADATDYRVFTAALASPPVDGLYPLGDHYYDLPTKFSRSDTAALTDFADVIKWMLLDMGVAALDIDDASFTAAKATFTSWGLTCNGAFWQTVPRAQALTQMLAQCHSTLQIAEQVSLQVLSATSQQTLTAADILKPAETGIGSFRVTRLERILADCGNVDYSPTGDSQDIGVNALVAAKTTKVYPDDERLAMPFIQDGDIAKYLAKLYFQRKLLKKSEQRFTTKATALALQPSDVLTLTGDNYGGAHPLLVDSMAIRRDASIDFICTEYSDTLDDYVGEGS